MDIVDVIDDMHRQKQEQFETLPFSDGTIERIAIDQLFTHMPPARTRDYMAMISAVTGLFEGIPFKFAGASKLPAAVVKSSFPLMKIFNPLSFGGLGIRAYMDLISLLDAIPFVGKRVVSNTASNGHECEFQLDPNASLLVRMFREQTDDPYDLDITFVAEPGKLQSYMTFGKESHCIPHNLYQSKTLTLKQVQDNFLYYLLHVKSPYAQHAHQRYAQMHGQTGGPGGEFKPEM